MYLDLSIEELKQGINRTSFTDVIEKLLQDKDKISFFSNLTNDDIKILLKNVILKKFSPNEMIFSQGEDLDNYIYYLLSGSVNILTKGEEGILKRVAILDKQTLLGEMKPILDEGRTATCIAGVNGSIAIGFIVEQNRNINSDIYARFYKNMSKILENKLIELNIDCKIEKNDSSTSDESAIYYKDLSYKLAQMIQGNNQKKKYKTN